MRVFIHYYMRVLFRAISDECFGDSHYLCSLEAASVDPVCIMKVSFFVALILSYLVYYSVGRGFVLLL